ncbi:Rhodanese-like domain-containing protein [Vararia minispora EC-137]|uniref:Rhodanese-like domain-containing protein n=1 Tax=Vararia minispora EC-137 TaxID=1314806 RepID=A0ACB8QXJ0_9AGAM|nr:Rhodanese-like domain-containing protein [Vararia minispora EC-137]
MPPRYITGDVRRSTSSFHPQITNVPLTSSQELARIMKSDRQPHKDYVVVDVRDNDRIGGHILHSHHSPSADFLDSVNDLVEKTKDVPTVIFHCALSQARGPKAARIFAETCDNLRVEGKHPSQDICILRGGFTDFQAKFRDDPKLIEKWNAEIWAADWSSGVLAGSSRV